MRTNRDRKITSGFEEVDKLLDEAEATGDLAALGKAERLLNALAVAVLDDSKDDPVTSRLGELERQTR